MGRRARSVALLSARRRTSLPFDLPCIPLRRRTMRERRPIQAFRCSFGPLQLDPRDRIVEPKLREVVTPGLHPTEALLAVQERDGGGRERLCDRADEELRRRCNGKVRL